VAFVVDDLVGWLITRLADAGYQKLSILLRGTDKARALKQAVTAAVQATVGELGPPDREEADRVAERINKAFGRRDPVPRPPGQPTMLEALQAGIAAQLAALDDPGLAGTGQSPAESLGVSGSVLAGALTGHLVWEIKLRGSESGPLAPLANQLNHDLTHLQGQRIEGVLADLIDKVTALAKGGSGAVVPGKPVQLAPRSVFLAGREDLLVELDARLASGDGPGPRLVVLSGLGGAGKTSVAVEYAHRHLDQVEVAWQFPAENATVLAAEFAGLAAQLVAAAAGGADSVATVHAVLAASPGGWLLVFDNAPDRASVAPFVPPAGPGRVLITSRNALWPPPQVVEVPVLDVEAAAGFLAERTADRDERAARALAGELGGLPLALEQAGAYIQATGDTLVGYLESFRRRRADLLARGDPARDPPETVAATWALAFTQLEQAAPAAAGLLRLLAYSAPDPVPLGLLLQPRPGLAEQLSQPVAEVLVPLLEDDLAAKDAVAALRRYSLVRPAGEGAVTVHRLVQAVTADKMPAWLASAWRHAAANLIEAALPSNPQQPSDWPAFAALLPHARAALDLTSGGMRRIAEYLGFRGSYPAARDLFRLIADAYTENDAYGAEHPDTLAARHNLAYWTGAAGDAAGARDQFAALLPARERVLGTEHRDTLATRADLARVTEQAGHADKAHNQLAALLPVMERVLGRRTPRHPDRPRRPGQLDRGSGGRGRGPRSVRRATASARAGAGRRAPGNPGRPQRP
jgi:hypothetical protein